MRWPVVVIALLAFAAILAGPFLISTNSLAQALFGIITTIISTSIGVWASWNYSKNSDKERLTRYGLLAWRNIDALSVKLKQQIQQGSARTETLESWLLDIDCAKWAWKDLLREVFELQERLMLEKEEVALDFKTKINSTADQGEKEKLESELRIEMARIRNKAPLPILEDETVSCPNCGSEVKTSLGSESGSTTWPECAGCRALFPIHRRSEGEIDVNAEAMKLPVTRACPKCSGDITWKVPTTKPVHFLYRCSNCDQSIQCDGTSKTFSVVAANGRVAQTLL